VGGFLLDPTLTSSSSYSSQRETESARSLAGNSTPASPFSGAPGGAAEVRRASGGEERRENVLRVRFTYFLVNMIPKLGQDHPG